MLITKQTDYAIRVLRSLAQGEKLTVTQISTAQGVPRPFAYKIVKKLETAGFVQILRGSSGGCVLAKDLRTISLYDLMEAMEETKELSACMDKAYVCTWRKEKGECLAHQRLGKLQAQVNQLLKASSMYSLIFDESDK